MATYAWPAADKRTLIGARVPRVDGPQKTTGVAKYAYDINRPGMLFAKLVTSPHAKADIASIDLTAAAAAPGVKATWKDAPPLTNVQYVGQIVAAVAAETEELATEAARLVKVEYKPQPHQVRDDDPALSTVQPAARSQGDVDAAFKTADVIVEGTYGCPTITHCCLESHGQVTEMREDELLVWPSTQAVSPYATGLATPTGVAANKIRVDCQYMGGGFGSKFGADQWGTIGALLSKQAGRPVKLMLERDQELMIAGNRPSAYAKIKVGATKDGKLTALEAEACGTSGVGGTISTQQQGTFPYVFQIPNFRVVSKRISTNRGSTRAWRAPNHPQNCFLTMSALADVAAALKMDELEFFSKNLDLVNAARRETYVDELKIAASLIGYHQKAHLRGDARSGPIKRGLGISMHTWGGQGHQSLCDVMINPDGSVEMKIGTQDLGVGTRTVLGQVVGDTLGLPFEAIKVNIGRNEYPASSPSGGSTTIGGVSVSSRKAATDALNALLEAVSPRIGVAADQLEARNGRIQQITDPAKGMAWKDACAALGVNSITKRGDSTPGPSVQQNLMNQGVGGVQMADVSVDIETGIVTMNEMVAVQDVGLVINHRLAESQVFGAVIMGITWALFEEVVYDQTSGKMLNADMEFYRLAGIKDIGQLKVHMMSGKGYDERGVIGIGEPPAVSPGAAISNAVANAIGVRVPHLPLTPDRVLAALAQKGGTPA